MSEALGLTGDDAKVMSLEFTAEEWANNARIRDVVAYVGFDARKILEQFFKKAKENPIGDGASLPHMETSRCMRRMMQRLI